VRADREDQAAARSKGKRTTMNKLMHGIVLAVFGLACWLISVILKVSTMFFSGVNEQLPAFTRFCLAIGPTVLLGVTGVAAIYCLVVWLRTMAKCPSWVPFLATTTSTVVLLMLPMIIAIYLPIIDLFHRLPRN
jgi:hypothetical protein